MDLNPTEKMWTMLVKQGCAGLGLANKFNFNFTDSGKRSGCGTFNRISE